MHMTVRERPLLADSARLTLWQFWWRYARVPLLVFVVVSSVLAFTRIDVEIARALFFDPSRMQWIAAHSGMVDALVHEGGRTLGRSILAVAVAFWIVACLRRDLQQLRRPAAYFVLASLLSIGTVGLLKAVTNVDCPWDLAEFGGRFPFISLFAHRSELWHRGHCFPAVHAGSGYALLTLFFVFRERHPTLARWGLAVGTGAGLLFGIAQQARGAHFLSHDVWSAFLVWTIALSIYTFTFQARLWIEAERPRED